MSIKHVKRLGLLLLCVSYPAIVLVLLACGDHSRAQAAEAQPKEKVWQVAEFADGNCKLYRAGLVDNIGAFSGSSNARGSNSLYITVCKSYSTVAMSR